MTDEKLSVAEKYIERQRDRFAYSSANTRVLKSYIEKLLGLDFSPVSLDMIVSKCVVNLSPDKARFFAGRTTY